MNRLPPGFHLLFWASLLLAAPAVFGQRAVIGGTVRDQTGSVLPGVHITVLNQDQGLTREIETDPRGYFSVPLLQPGAYTLQAQHSGFAVATVGGIHLHISDILNVEVVMSIGAPTVRIEVRSRDDQVATVSPEVGHVVTGEVIRDAPLNGRDVISLALLQPGVLPDAFGSRFSVAGNRGDSVAYLLDGGVNNDLLDNHQVYDPNPDTVAEFRILTGNYPAEYGRNSGGVVAIATRSGTKDFHGAAFEYLRNDALDANSYFHKNAADGVIPRAQLRRHQFGGTFGGPLMRVGKNSDRAAFFFFGYQGERETLAQTSIRAAAFTPAELSGDFSQSGPGGGPDPNVAAFLQQNPYFQPDANLSARAILDPSRIDPVASQYIAKGWIPQAASGFIQPTGTASLRSQEFTLKTDFLASAKDRFFLTLGGDDALTLTPFNFSNTPDFPARSGFKDLFSNLTYARIFRANLLNEFRVTAQRGLGDSGRPALSQGSPQDLGIHITPDQATGPANLVFDFGSLQLGPSEIGPQRLVDDTFSFSDVLSWNRGRHNLKFGTSLTRFHNDTAFSFVVNGEFQFFGPGGFFSQNAFADFLLGLPIQFRQSPRAPSNLNSKSSYGFVQDEWHLHKRFVLTAGLRYEFSTPKTDSEGRSFSVIPGQKSQVFTNAPVGLVFPGDAGTPRGTNFSDKHDWGPRIGFAWDVTGTGRTSLRGGAGVVYDILKGEDNLQFNGQPPFFSSAGFLFFPSGQSISSAPTSLSFPYETAGVPNPFPSSKPPADVSFAEAGFLPFGSSGSTYTVDPHLGTPRITQFDLNLQHEFAYGLVMELDFSGTRSHGLTSLVDANPVVLGTTDRVLNLTPGNQSCTSATAFLCSFASLPEFRNVAKASYNGLQASLKKTVTEGGWFGSSYFTFAYTYSHNIDNAGGFARPTSLVPAYAPRLFRASSDFDIRQRVVVSGGWNVPFDRWWESGPERLVRGWSLFPILAARTGTPFDIPAGLQSSLDFTSPGPSGAGDPGLVRANQVGALIYNDPRRVSAYGSSTGHYWFDPTAFSNQQCSVQDPSCQPSAAVFPSDVQAVANPAVRTYGTQARNSLRAPSLYNLNLAVSKKTQLFSERSQLEFRADFFNLLNHAEFGIPNNNINSHTFGQILSTVDPRIIQLAVRISF